jgi:hypothetical protein
LRQGTTDRQEASGNVVQVVQSRGRDEVKVCVREVEGFLSRRAGHAKGGRVTGRDGCVCTRRCGEAADVLDCRSECLSGMPSTRSQDQLRLHYSCASRRVSWRIICIYTCIVDHLNNATPHRHLVVCEDMTSCLLQQTRHHHALHRPTMLPAAQMV